MPAGNYKCTKARVRAILKEIEGGAFRSRAARLAGISRDTFARWLKEGERDALENVSSNERELYEGLEAAEIKAEKEHIQNIRCAGKTDWRASAWWLERRLHNDYGRRQPDPRDDGPEDEVIIIG